MNVKVCELKVIALINAGWYNNEIAEYFQVHKRIILDIAKKYNLCFKQYSAYIDESREAKLIDDYISGEIGVEKLFKKYKIGKDFLKIIFKRNNIKYPEHPKLPNNGPLVERLGDSLLNIKFQYEETDKEAKLIAKEFLIGQGAVKRLAKQFGWKRNNWKRKYFKEIWARDVGKENAEAKFNDFLKTQEGRNKGENNPMYGKPSPQGAGNGWKGRFNGHYFRSLRELVFLLQNYENGIDPKSAERKIYSIEYEWMGSKRTYRPDFLIGDTLYEIKPKRLINSPNIIAKTKAAIEFAKNNNLNYVIADVIIDSDLILKYVSNKMVVFDRDYLERFLSYMAKQ